MRPVTVTITAPDVLAALKVATRRKDQPASQAAVTALAEQGLRAALGLRLDLTPRQAAQWLGCCLNTIKNYMRDGRFPNLYYRSPRAARIPLRDIEALKKRTVRMQ